MIPMQATAMAGFMSVTRRNSRHHGDPKFGDHPNPIPSPMAINGIHDRYNNHSLFKLDCNELTYLRPRAVSRGRVAVNNFNMTARPDTRGKIRAKLQLPIQGS